MTIPSEYVPNRSILARFSRRLTQWRTAEPLKADPSRPIVTFTFDDFPKSAAETGARIVEDAGGRATFYACSSYAGTTSVTGEQFDRDDIAALLVGGHEIGSHTHSHIDCAKSDLNRIGSDIETNLKCLRDLGAGDIQHFAYPYGETQRGVKQALRSRFRTARGVLAGINGAGSDRMQLRALELTPNPATTQRAIDAIHAAKTSPAWVILFTHDVATAPSAYGTTPQVLRDIASAAHDSGADILSMGDAMNQMEDDGNA